MYIYTHLHWQLSIFQDCGEHGLSFCGVRPRWKAATCWQAGDEMILNTSNCPTLGSTASIDLPASKS